MRARFSSIPIDFIFGFVSFRLVSFRFGWFRFVSAWFRFVLFRFVSIGSVSFRFVLVSFRTLSGPYLCLSDFRALYLTFNARSGIHISCAH